MRFRVGPAASTDETWAVVQFTPVNQAAARQRGQPDRGASLTVPDQLTSAASLPVIKRHVALPLLSFARDKALLHVLSSSPLSDQNALAALCLVAVCFNLSVLRLGTEDDELIFELRPLGEGMEKQSVMNLSKMFGSVWEMSASLELMLIRLTDSICRDKASDKKRKEANLANQIPTGPCYCKPWPSETKGLTVIEFFSGIGGFRLSLPDKIRERQIKKIIAIDCNDTVCDVYDHNFHKHKTTETFDGISESEMRRVLIAQGSVNVEDVDNIADIWTMSPPCQPYTKTRGARGLDDGDNRSRGMSHIITLLDSTMFRPRLIVLENVAGFHNSNMLGSLKTALRRCGYAWREYLLSPSDFGIPNERKRYYLTAECLLPDTLHINPSSPTRTFFIPYTDNHLYTHLDGEDEGEDERGKSAAVPFSMSDVILPAFDDDTSLRVPLKVLSAKWAATRLSICGRNDMRTFCFTKGYGRLWDKSSGSLVLTSSSGLMRAHEIDRTRLADLFGRVRRFSPEELLRLFGFPPGFDFPPHLSLGAKFAAIGNSVSVFVISRVIRWAFPSCSLEESGGDV